MNELMRRLLFLPKQASSYAADIDALHYAVISVTMLGAFMVSIVVGVFLVRYRESTGRERDIPPVEENGRTRGGLPVWLEFTAIGVLLALFVGFWVVGYRQYINLRTPPTNTLDIYATGKKWMWSFAYPDGGGSNAVLYVPVNQPIRLILTSRDVIHSFYVPQFRLKQDAVPGRATTAWFEAIQPGTYDIFCTEYCGTGHSTMRGRVEVLPEAEYQRTLQGLPRESEASTAYAESPHAFPTPARTSMSTVGERIAAAHGCLRCHTVDGTPHIGPTWAGAYGSVVTLENGKPVEVDATYVTESIMDPMAKIHHGYAPVMPSYQGRLGAGEIGALVEYMRSLRVPPQTEHPAPLLPPGSPSVLRLPQQNPAASNGSPSKSDAGALPEQHWSEQP